MPRRHGGKERNLEASAGKQRSLQLCKLRGRGVSIVVFSVVLWPRQPAGKSSLVSPSLAAPHDFGSMGSPGTTVFPAKPRCMPAVSQHERDGLTALACEPGALLP